MQENCSLYISINKSYPHVKSDAVCPKPVIITLVYVDNPWKCISYIRTTNELIPHPTFWYGWTLEVTKHTTDYKTNIGTYCDGYINYLLYYLVPSWYISTLCF